MYVHACGSKRSDRAMVVPTVPDGEPTASETIKRNISGILTG